MQHFAPQLSYFMCSSGYVCPFCPCPPPLATHTQHTHTQHTHTLFMLHMRRRFATFSAICAVFHVHVHVQDMKIFQSAYFAFFLSLSLSRYLPSYVTAFSHPLYIYVLSNIYTHVCVLQHSSWEIVHLHYHNGNGFDLSARVVAFHQKHIFT